MSDDLSFYSILEQYPDEASAERYFIAHRWPNGAQCPRCQSANVLRGTQPGRSRQLWICHGCDKRFSVTSGTVMQDTKLPLRKWLLAFQFMGASKKGISALQLSRMLKLTYKSAWHLCHRIRETMKNDSQVFTGIVETDETYIGGRRTGRGRGYIGNKATVTTIIRRNSAGKNDSQAQSTAYSYESVDGRTVGPNLRKHTIPSETVLMTDTSPIYSRVGESFSDHHTVNHKAKEYVREDWDGHLATTNTAEGFFANLKRQTGGTHHSVSKKHLQRYLEEHDFKFNNRQVSDGARTAKAVSSIEGRRLTLHKSPSGGPSLFDGKIGERRRKLKRPVKKTKSTRDALAARAAPIATPVPRRAVASNLPKPLPRAPAPAVARPTTPAASAAHAPARPVATAPAPRKPVPPSSVTHGRELPRVPPKKPPSK